MAVTSRRAGDGGHGGPGPARPLPSGAASKWDIREKVWEHLEASGLAEFPRPVRGRIPNFKGASHAAARLLGLPAFRAACAVKINPDAPQRNARFLTLEVSEKYSLLGCFPLPGLPAGLLLARGARRVPQSAGGEGGSRQTSGRCAAGGSAGNPGTAEPGAASAAHLWTSSQWESRKARKTLLVPTPRLRTGLFNRIVPPPGATKEILRKCATSQGVRDYSVPVGLDSKAQVDLVIVGSVAVSEKGWRIGKGEGYADMEYAMMVSMGAVQEDTPVVTIVHDCQVLDIAEELLDDHDLTVDYILTPTRTIQTNCKRPKPQGIMWHKVSSEMLGKIPILKTLRCREKQAGKDVTLQDEHPALANTNRAAASNKKVMAANTQPGAAPGTAPVGQPHVGSDPGNPKFEGSDSITTVYVGNLPGSLRVSELKSALRELQVVPAGLSWQGAQHGAFLAYRDPGTAHRALSSLRGLSLGGNALRAELANGSKGQGEISRHK